MSVGWRQPISKTSPIKPGDVVEVELERVGVLRNRVVAEK